MPIRSEHVRAMAPQVLDAGVVAAGMLRALDMSDDAVVDMVIREALPDEEAKGMEAAYIESLKYLLGLAVVRLAKQNQDLIDIEKRVTDLFELAQQKGVVES